MKPKGYTARYYGHIESVDYRDGYGQLWLQCGSGTPRIYCADTVKLPFPRRELVLKNMCDYYETVTNPAIVVVEETDKDREELERMIARLCAEGEKLTMECVTEGMEAQFENGWQLRWLGAGKRLKIEGTEISTVEDYVRWKEAQGASPNAGPADPSGNSGVSGGPPSVS